MNKLKYYRLFIIGTLLIVAMFYMIFTTVNKSEMLRWKRNAIAGDSIQLEYKLNEFIRTQKVLTDSISAMGIKLRKVTAVGSMSFHYSSKDTIVLAAKEIIREKNIQPDISGIYNIPIFHKDSCLTIQGKLLSKDIESVVSLDKIDLKASILKVDHIDRMKNGLFRTKLFGTKYIKVTSRSNCGDVSTQDIVIKK